MKQVAAMNIFEQRTPNDANAALFTFRRGVGEKEEGWFQEEEKKRKREEGSRVVGGVGRRGGGRGKDMERKERGRTGGEGGRHA